MANQQAAGAEAFIQSIGVNTHLDFYGGPYGNLGMVESALSYLGVQNIRDSAANAGDVSAWQQVAQATGARFDAFIGEVGPGNYSTELSTIRQMAGQGLLNAIEGVNEPDAAYSASIGESTGGAASYQQQVWQTGQQLGLPVINTVFGNINNYGSTGDLSAWTDYANAHIYFGTGNNPDWNNWTGTLNADAQASAAGRPVIVTETGYYTTGNGGDPSNVDETVQAKYTLDALLDDWQAGDARFYLYELLDQGTGNGNPESNFGLFHSDGSPKLAAVAVHNLISLLNDPGGAGMSGGSLDYTLSGMQGTDHSQLLQKSDGTYWLALWNDTRLSGPFSPAEVSVPPHSVTLNLGSAASNIQVFDPLSGTSAVQSASGNTLTFALPDHPILVEIGGAGGAPVNSGTAGGTPTPLPSTAPSPQPSSNGMSLTAPASAQDVPWQNRPITGVQITDNYATTHPDTVTATVTDQSGTLSTADAWGNAQQGSGASGLTLSGTVWQVNAGLANLSYTGDGSDTVSIQTTDSAGNQATQTITIGSGSGSSGSGTPTPAPTQSGSGQQIAADDPTPVITASNTTVSASAGDHMIFIGGTGDTLTATGGTESVEAYQGGNAITTGAGDDTIRIAGSGNTIDAGAGNNHLEDSGSNNTIVLPGAGHGNDDIFGWVTQNGDTFDLRPLLAQTQWNGDRGSIGNYVQVNMGGDSAVITVDPSGTPGGGSYNVATLHASGAMDLSALLAHAIT
jgi:hypothetical protein